MNRIEAVESIVRAWGYPRAFEWGVSDCAIFANEVHLAITGEHLLADWPNYSTPLGASRTLKKLGYNHLDQALDERLERVDSLLLLRAGDLVAIDPKPDSGPWNAMGMAMGEGRVFLCGQGTWITITPAAELLTGAAWRVG